MTHNITALITGANRGIGFEVARQLGRKGITVLVGARAADAGAAAAARLQQDGAEAYPATIDVTAFDTLSGTVNALAARFGRIDILVNNAGVFLDRYSPLQLDVATLNQTLQTNVSGPFALMRAVLPLMQRHGYGRIVNVSSKMGQLDGMGRGSLAYRTSKTALNAMTRIFAAEAAGADILINAASPGWVRSDMGGPNAARSLTEGADTIVWLATLPSGGPTGGFFHDREPIPW